MNDNLWYRLVNAHQELNTARNFLNDAMAETQPDDQPVTKKQAKGQQNRVKGQIEQAERNIKAAKRSLGMDDD